MEKHVDIAIIGAGAAGLGTAVAAYDHGVKDILILERKANLGGILNQCIHAGFGLNEYKEELTGPEFLTRLANEVKRRGIEYRTEAFVTSLTPDKVLTYLSPKEGFVKVYAKAVVMAAGSLERTAGAIAVPGDRPKGVMPAGEAQLALNEMGYMVGKKVFILGSGDIGLIMARRLSLEGAKVLAVAEIMPYSNGLLRNKIQCLDDFGIPLLLSHTVGRVIGRERLEAVEIVEVDDKLQPIAGTGKIYECDALILSVGLIPNNGLLNNIGIKQGRAKGSEVDDSLETSVPGIFTAGNVLHIHDLADFALDEGRQAGLSAARFVLGETQNEKCLLDVNVGDGISYVLPEHVDLNGPNEILKLKFRARKPHKQCSVEIKQGDKLLKKIVKLALLPSELEIISIPKKLLENNQQPIVVSVVDKEVDP